MLPRQHAFAAAPRCQRATAAAPSPSAAFTTRCARCLPRDASAPGFTVHIVQPDASYASRRAICRCPPARFVVAWRYVAVDEAMLMQAMLARRFAFMLRAAGRELRYFAFSIYK
jgi:hypothetical protein